MNKEFLKNIIIDQRETIAKKFNTEKIVERDGIDRCKKYLNYPNLLLISGLRRAGKSFFSHLLLQNNQHPSFLTPF